MATNVRVELRQMHPQASGYEKDVAFKKLMGNFRRKCTQNSVVAIYRDHESYESPSQKKRRKKKEAELARLKNQLKDNFWQKERE